MVRELTGGCFMVRSGADTGLRKGGGLWVTVKY